MPVDLHPQTKSFLALFPTPASGPRPEGRLASHLDRIWIDSCSRYSLAIPFKFTGLSAHRPRYDHKTAEMGGITYAYRLFAHFGPNLIVPLGNIPYPDENGEFVLNGHRYYVSMFVRAPSQIAEMRDRENSRLKNLKKSLGTEFDIGSFVEFFQIAHAGLSSHVAQEAALQANGVNQADEVEDEVTPEEVLEKMETSGDQSEERNTGALRVLLVGDLLEIRIVRFFLPCMDRLANEIAAEIRLKEGQEEQQEQYIKGLFKSYLGGCLEERVENLILHEVGRLVNLDNPLSRISQRRELSFYGPGGVHPESTKDFNLRDVDDNDLGKICPVQTPQGPSLGLRLYLARHASIDVRSRCIVARPDLESGDSLGDAASLIPFVNHDDVARALMGTNMMRQALALERPEPPLIQTGWEKELGSRPEVPPYFKAEGLLALGTNLLVGYLPWGLDTFEDGVVVSVSGAATLTSVQEKVFWIEEKRVWRRGGYGLLEITRNNGHLDSRALGKLDSGGVVKVGEKVCNGDVLASAIVRGRRVSRKTDIIDALLEVAYGEDLAAEDQSLRFNYDGEGEVLEIVDSALVGTPSLPLGEGVSRRVGVRVRLKRPVSVGDKLTGRHGNKGVVVRILPDREVPYMKTTEGSCSDPSCSVGEPHRHLQVILNPLGVVGRLNVGQLYETSLARVAEEGGNPYFVPPFAAQWTSERLASELQTHGFAEDGKEQLYLLDQGQERPLRYRSLIGPQYILRLYHIATDKVHGRGMGEPWDYTSRDDQPKAGKKRGGGQRIGEQETWALAAHKGWNLLDDFLTVKSDDRARRGGISEVSEDAEISRRPQAFANLILALRTLGLEMRLWDANHNDVTEEFLLRTRGLSFERVSLDLASNKRIEAWQIKEEVSSSEFYARKRGSRDSSQVAHPYGLLSRKIFTKRSDLGKIQLRHPIVNPLFAKILWEIFCYHQDSKSEFRGCWATELCDFIQRENKWPEVMKRESDEWFRYARVKGWLEKLKAGGRQPKDYLLSVVPVLPICFRTEEFGRFYKYQHSLNLLYRDVIIANQRQKKLEDRGEADIFVKDSRERLFKAVQGLYFGKYNFKGRYSNGILDILSGKQGLLRGHLAGKRADFSGRAVIVGDPTVPLDEVRLPQAIWSAIFSNRESIRELVLLNRQPSLHRYSMQAFYASPHSEGDVIRINPFVCKGFNADFDGDTMAVHVPGTAMAKSEAVKLLPSQNVFSQANGDLALGFGGDIAIGLVYLTHDPDIVTDDEIPVTKENELPLRDRDIRDVNAVGNPQTTVGRLLARRIFGSVQLTNRPLQARDGSLSSALKTVGWSGNIKEFTEGLSDLLTSTLKLSGLSISIQDFASWGRDIQASLAVEGKKKDPPFLWFHWQAAAKGEVDQIIGPRGAMDRPGSEKQSGTITSGLLGGHSEVEYLWSAHGARTGLTDKGLTTAPAGVLLRRLIYDLQAIYIVAADCNTTEGLPASDGDISELEGRFGIEGRMIRISPSGGGSPLKSGSPLIYRSPSKCQARSLFGQWGICQKCYGIDPATGAIPELGLPVGILAAQAIGERATQVALSGFHKGGKRRGMNPVDLQNMIYKPKGGVRNDDMASRWVSNMVLCFKELGGAPRRVHFEVILAGIKRIDYFADGFLADLVYAKVADTLRFGAARKVSDNLYGVISRIVSGRLLGTDPMGENHGEANVQA